MVILLSASNLPNKLVLRNKIWNLVNHFLYSPEKLKGECYGPLPIMESVGSNGSSS